MKNLGLLFLFVFSVLFSSAQSIEFESKVIDYGIIDHNSDGNREFNFKNIGDANLEIKSAKGSCGCTVPDFKKDDGTAVWEPGESGVIKVKYATNRIGKFTKTVTISTNMADKKPVILTIKGEVLAPEKETGVPTKDTKGSPIEE